MAWRVSDVAARKGWGTKVTVVESSKIGVIGVGEGSTAVFRQMLRHFKLDEDEFPFDAEMAEGVLQVFNHTGRRDRRFDGSDEKHGQ